MARKTSTLLHLLLISLLSVLTSLSSASPFDDKPASTTPEARLASAPAAPASVVLSKATTDTAETGTTSKSRDGLLKTIYHLLLTGPATPTQVTASTGERAATLAWQTVPGAASYNLYWSNSPGVTCSTGTKIAGVTSPYTHSGLTPGSAYYYVVTAVDGGDESNASAEASAVPEPAYKLYGLDFSPYTDGQDPNLRTPISEAQLRSRLEVVAPYTRWIRVFGSSSGLEKTASLARGMSLKIAASAWLSKSSTDNASEITRLISIGQAGQADLLIVGSEVLLRNDLTESQLIAYIRQVKQAVPGVPVTTADIYSTWLAHPHLVPEVSSLMVNYYPYWEGSSIDFAICHVDRYHEQVKALAGSKEVIVSETGWPSAGNQIGDAVPSPENAAGYFLDFVSWAKTNAVPYFYFEAFDESWKAKYEGPQGAHWGIWDKNAVMKAGMLNVFEDSTRPIDCSGNVVIEGEGPAELVFTRVPPIGSGDFLKGKVRHVAPASYRVAVYIKVGGGWWTKPYFNAPLTPIEIDGSWSCDIVTGGYDSSATSIAAYLVPVGYNPPARRGGSTLPAELDQNSVAKVVVSR